jgi:hypothetical protein
MLFRSTWLLLIVYFASTPVFAGYQGWNLVDVGAVVCPKPPAVNVTSYRLYIPDAPAMNKANAHIISFMRTSSKNVTVSFRVDDANGDEVVPNTSVTLQDLTGNVSSSCVCKPTVLPADAAAKYGSDYGSSCSKAWDQDNCGNWWGSLTLGTWCCKRWCFADPSCPDAYQSISAPGAYWSYAACSAQNVQVTSSTCKWSAEAKKTRPMPVQGHELFVQQYNERYISGCLRIYM